MPTHHRLCLTLATLSLLAGCGQNSAPRPVEPAPAEAAETQTTEVPAALQRTTASGFLGDYSKLQPNPAHKGSLIQRSDKLAAYKTFLIETPKVLPTSTVRGEPITPSAATELAADLKTAASDALNINFKLTDRPGDGVAKVRLAITQVAESFHEPSSPQRKIGGASVEMEIVDAVTGERLAAATESDAVTTNDPELKSPGPYYDAKLVFQHWAARLAKSLTDAQP